MRVAFLTDSFSRNRGYSSNMLPWAMARCGVEADLVATALLPYQEGEQYSSLGRTYDKFAQTEERSVGEIVESDGVRIHTMDHTRSFGFARIKGLAAKLEELRPDVVQCFSCAGLVPLDAAKLQARQSFRLFTECHMHASVHRLAAKSVPFLSPVRARAVVVYAVGAYIARRTSLCYPIAKDCQEIARRFYGVPKEKSKVVPLGTDTSRFRPPNAEDRETAAELRRSLGIGLDDTVGIYTGRFSEAKNPLLLAKAVAAARSQGKPWRGLFVGDGEQRGEIESQPGCVVHAFVPHTDLPRFYWAADVGVWPTQESMSMLDAAACGLPIVVNDRIGEPERAEGSGLLFRAGNLGSLADALLQLGDPALRSQLGDAGARKVAADYSWDKIARDRLADFEAELARG